MTALAEAMRRHWPSYVAAHGPRIPVAHRRARRQSCAASRRRRAWCFKFHIHYLVPAGALTATGWIRPDNPAILVPAKPLAVRVRNRMREALKAADFKLYCTIPSKAWRKPWNVDARPVGRGGTAFGYLARYIQKTALDAARILKVTDTHVVIAWIDRESGKQRTAKLTGQEFLRRFLQHVLPKGFVRVRHFGFLSAAARTRFARVRALLRAAEVTLVLPPKLIVSCPCCAHPMTFLRCIRARGPPLHPA